MSKLTAELKPGLTLTEFEMPEFDGTYQPRSQEPVTFQFMALDQEEREAAMTLAEALEEADKTRRQAEAEAEETLRRAREEAERLTGEAERLHAEAWDKGRAEGHEKGLAEGREKGLRNFENAAAPSLQAFSRLENIYQDLWAVNEVALVKLAQKVAERVVLQELTVTPEAIGAAFKAALEHLHEQHQAVFRINPEDLEHLEAVRGEMRDLISGLAKITFEPDPNLPRGDLIMETDAGRVDATLRRRVESVTSAVDEVLKEKFFELDW